VRRLLTIAVTWASLWFATMAAIMLAIGIVDPDSIDPGEPLQAVFVFGPMGLLSGLAFALFVGAWLPARSVAGVVALGFLGSALAQVPFLGHGDNGLLANVFLALMFAVIGGLVTLVWQAGKRYVAAGL
jgi:hypothetical protein